MDYACRGLDFPTAQAAEEWAKAYIERVVYSGGRVTAGPTPWRCYDGHYHSDVSVAYDEARRG